MSKIIKNNKKSLKKTPDGSCTIYSEHFNEFYHNVNGALTESKHIYIDLGLKSIEKDDIKILEIGYGTGLNALCTFFENHNLNKNIYYIGIEKYPLKLNEFMDMNFNRLFNIGENLLLKFFQGWDIEVAVSDNFRLLKKQIDFLDYTPCTKYDLIYYDAFSPDTQPEMWSLEVLNKIINNLNSGGVFVTYCVRGDLKEKLRSLGLKVKRFPGPPGKRHVLKAEW